MYGHRNVTDLIISLRSACTLYRYITGDFKKIISTMCVRNKDHSFGGLHVIGKESQIKVFELILTFGQRVNLLATYMGTTLGIFLLTF